MLVLCNFLKILMVFYLTHANLFFFFNRKFSFSVFTKTIHWLYTGWPRKNATLTIDNFKKTRDRMKKLCA